MNFIKLIDLVLSLFDAGSAAYARVVTIRAKLSAMQAEGRDPTQSEWDALFASIADDSARLDAADKRLNPGGGNAQ